MTELEKIQRAKMYIESLANGIDPITEKELPNDTCLNNVRLARCFFYVSEILEKVIQNDGVIGKKQTIKRDDFVVSDELLNALNATEENLQISEFAKYVSEVAAQLNMKNIPTTAFTNWLLEKDFLKEEVLRDNKRRKTINENSRSVGILGETRSGMYGEYTAVIYSMAAQQFLIDNLEQIVEHWKK